MFKKLLAASISASLLLSLPLSADHHHHHDRVRETIIEVKAKEKSTGQKALAGSIQTANKLAWLLAIPAAYLLAKYTPVPSNLNGDNESIARILICAGSYFVSGVIIKTTTAAVMSQENIKPLKK